MGGVKRRSYGVSHTRVLPLPSSILFYSRSTSHVDCLLLILGHPRTFRPPADMYITLDTAQASNHGHMAPHPSSQRPFRSILFPLDIPCRLPAANPRYWCRPASEYRLVACTSSLPTSPGASVAAASKAGCQTRGSRLESSMALARS